MTDTEEPRVRGAWPLVAMDGDGRPMWHVAGTNPPEYDYDLRLEALWRKSREKRMSITTLHGDCREMLPTLDAGSIQCVVTSPPYYGLRKYTDDAREIGREQTPAEYIAALVDVFAACRRVLRDDGTLWVNIGDSYASDSKWGGATGGKHAGGLHGSSGVGREKRETGLGDKQLIGIPWRLAFALQDDGWILRSDIIWQKPNAMPESVKDRPTRSHEYVFLLSKARRYFYDADAIKEPAVDGDPAAPRAPRGAATPNSGRRDKQGDSGLRRYEGFNARWDARAEPLTHRNARTVWTIPTQPLADEHYAPMPEALADRCILAGSRAGDTVLDPFAGSGTTLRSAARLQRRAVGIELGGAYLDIQERRTNGAQVEMFV